jgi:hypothetical protein
MNRAPIALLALLVFSPGTARAAADCSTLKDFVVKVQAESRSGTGLIVGLANGVAQIVTAEHVVRDASKIQIAFFRSQNVLRDATLQEWVREFDLAMLQVPASWVNPPTLNISDDVTRNQAATPLGHPPGLPWHCGNESVTDPAAPDLPDRFIFSSPVYLPGISGAPVFNDIGELLGIATDRGPSGNEVGVRIRKALFGISWKGPVNLVSPQRASNAVLAVRTVRNEPSTLVLDVDYRYGMSSVGAGQMVATPLMADGRAPEHMYVPGDVNEVNGSTRVTINTSTGDVTTTLVQLCIYTGSPPKIVVCRTFALMKTWSQPVTTKVTDIVPRRTSDSQLQLAVTYNYELADDPASTSLITFVLRGGQRILEFGSTSAQVRRGRNSETLEVTRIKQAAPTDALQVCFVARVGGIFGCHTIPYAVSW